MKKREHSAKAKLAAQRQQNLTSNKERLSRVSNVTEEEFALKGKTYNDKLSAYNTQVKGLEEIIKEIKKAEREYCRYGSLFLSGVYSTYGPDSEEYRLAGGVPLSDRNTGKKKEAVAEENN